MSVPGMNLLAVALTAIQSQPVAYIRFLGRQTNAQGRDEDTYAKPVPVFQCSVQPVPRDKYEYLGLEQTKVYYKWFVPAKVVGIERDGAGDRVKYNGKLLQISNTTPWNEADGWVEALCVQINLKGQANA